MPQKIKDVQPPTRLSRILFRLPIWLYRAKLALRPRPRKSNDEYRPNPQPVNTPTALEIVSDYTAARARGDSERINELYSPDFVLDIVSGDAFEDDPLSVEETRKFWPSWFGGFSEMDYEVTRTIAAKEVVVTEWIFTGANTKALEPPVFGRRVEPMGKTIRFRGVSIYDVSQGLIQRETLYLDLATLWVELGVEL